MTSELDNRHWLSIVKEIRRERMSDSSNTRPIVFLSTINGYHHFRNTPREGVFMQCFAERNNRYDPHAVIIRNDNGVVGRMPAGLSWVFHNNDVEKVWCIYIGRMRHDGPVRGGGPKLICFYIVETNDESVLTTANFIRQYVDENTKFL